MAIRVVYRWKVPAENRAAFAAAWRDTTTAIRADTDGARGSVLLESCDDPAECLTVAHWDSLDQWRSFIDAAPTSRMKTLHDLAERVSVEAFRQVGDETI